MSDDQQITVPANHPDNCSAKQSSMVNATAACLVQPAKDDAAATCVVQSPKDNATCPVPPPNDEVKMSSNDDDAAYPVPPPNDEAETSDVVMSANDDDAACPVPPPNDEAETSDVVMSSNDNDAACPVPPPNDEAETLNVVMSSNYDDAAYPVPPPNDETEPSDVVMSSKDNDTDTDTASPAPHPNSDAGLAPTPNSDAGLAPTPNSDAGPPSPPNIDANPAPPSMDDIAHPADETVALVPKVEPESSNANGFAVTDDYDAGAQVKDEIKHETIDLGNDTYFYDDNNKAILIKGTPKVGFDRGLEPDHIVGATEMNGKLMFLIAWKNSEIADLLESTVVYDRCPQIAIQFFEARLRYCPKEKKN